jgi:hypothetical protein
MGPLGRTSLHEQEYPPIERDFAGAKKEWEEAREKAK